MNMNFRYFFIVTLPRYSMLSFILCVGIAKYLYSGGIYHMVSENGASLCPGATCQDSDHKTIGYSFFKNFLSDLGRTVTHGGHNNFHSSLLFNMALTFGGVTYILFYVYLRGLFKSNPIAKYTSISAFK